MSNKPKILTKLERQLLNDLENLDPNEDPVEERLRVFREAFCRLIRNIKTLGPILERIKQEYDVVFTHLSSENKLQDMRNNTIMKELQKLQEDISSDEEDVGGKCENPLEWIMKKKNKDRKKKSKIIGALEEKNAALKIQLAIVSQIKVVKNKKIEDIRQENQVLLEEMENIKIKYETYKAAREEVIVYYENFLFFTRP